MSHRFLQTAAVTGTGEVNSARGSQRRHLECEAQRMCITLCVWCGGGGVRLFVPGCETTFPRQF